MLELLSFSRKRIKYDEVYNKKRIFSKHSRLITETKYRDETDEELIKRINETLEKNQIKTKNIINIETETVISPYSYYTDYYIRVWVNRSSQN